MIFYLISIIFLYILYLVYYNIIGPYITLSLYKKKYPKGIIYKFFPVYGMWKDAVNDFNSDKDIANKMFELNNFAKDKDHKVKMIISNHGEPHTLSFMICDKDIAKEFLVNKQHLFEKQTKEFFLFDELMSEGVLMQSGKLWKQQRSLIAPLFHFQKIKDRIPSMLDSTQILVDKLNPVNYDKMLQNKDSQDNLSTLLQETTARIVVDSFFGQQNEFKTKSINGISLAIEIQSLVEQSMGYAFSNTLSQLRAFVIGSHSRKTLPMMFFDKNEKQFFKRADDLKNYITDEIIRRKNMKKENKQQDQKQDFLDICLESPEFTEETNIIYELFLTLFFAGMDTTANLVLVSLYYLSKNPDIQSLLRNEVKEIFQSDEDYLDMNKYNQVTELNKFIYEVLRIKSPAPSLFSRYATQDMTLGEFNIPKGSQVNVSIMSNNFNSKYVNDPYKFDINRPENQENINNFNFLPFSGGPRNCIGQHMALCESKIFLSKILQQYQVLPNQQGELDMEFLFLYTPKNKNIVKFQKI